MRLWRDGGWRRGHGWMSTRRQVFPFGRRWVGLCDVPDLALFPLRYPGVRTVVFRAGLELRRLHFGTLAAAWLVRLGLVRDLARHARVLRRVSEWFLSAGSDVGGMLVDLRGRDPQGLPLRLRWSLRAGAGDGPRIPATPAVVLARKLADENLSARGAELTVLGATHAELGGCLLATWGLPLPILEAIAWHHEPERSAGKGFSLLAAVHVANVFAQEASPAGGVRDTPRPRSKA